MSDFLSTVRNRTRTVLTSIAPVKSSPGRVTLRVDSVVPAREPLWLSTLGESLELRSGASILAMPDRDMPALAAEGYAVKRALRGAKGPAIEKPLPAPPRRFGGSTEAEFPPAARLFGTKPLLHPLMQAIHTAFSEHRPLVLGPDCIWLTIVQGFGHHVQENAEELRHQIVRHVGKRALIVSARSLDADQWPGLVSQFNDLIRGNSDPVLYETLMCDFSTTTPNIRTGLQVALMDVYESYFEYDVMCVCGIPAITLEGTAEDWQRMRERIEVLATYGLETWVARLIPILDEFVATAKGRPSRKFWQAIYKPRKAYATELATGWIADLFPYLGDPPHRRRNHVLDVPRNEWVVSAPKDRESFPGFASVGVSMGSFPSGLSRAPVTIRYPDGSIQKVDLLGGFFGVGQRSDNNGLFPLMSWALAEANNDEMVRDSQASERLQSRF